MDEIKDVINFDRLIHGPARLAIMAVLSACESADFVYLLNVTGLGKGNLSSHLGKLKEAGYITAAKGFKGRYPNTSCALTAKKGTEGLQRLSKAIPGIGPTSQRMTILVPAFLPIFTVDP